MLIQLLVILLIALILSGLYMSTEKVLATRQKRRDRGEDPHAYL